MGISFSTRVRFLAGIALGLASALAVHAMNGGEVIPRRWMTSTPPEEVGGQVGSHSHDRKHAPTPRPNPTAQSAYDMAFFDGGESGELATPTPEAPTPPAAAAAEGDQNELIGVVREDNGKGVFVDVAGQNTPRPEDEMLGAVAVSRKSAPLVVPTRVGTPVAGRSWVYGQARGYAMLYAMQPEARAVVESQVSALLSAKVREPFIAVLIDGTFGQDFDYLKDIIRRLSADGRNLTLSLYLSNGATMRKSDETLIDAPFVRTNPEKFRGLIRRTDNEYQARYTRLAVQAREIFDYHKGVNPDGENVAVVMLEDNLDSESYRAMLLLARNQLEGVATIARNPCDDCGVPGTDADTLGYPREEHRVERFSSLVKGDGFTLDGRAFEYPLGPDSSAITSTELSTILMDAYQKRLRYFGLWRYNWQGLVEGQGNPLPAKRTYVPSSQDELEFEIEALRTGLEVEPDQTDDEGGSDKGLAF